MGGEVCGLRGRASPGTQAEGGRLAVQMPPPQRTRLATQVTMTANRLRTGPCGHRLDRHEGRSRERGLQPTGHLRRKDEPGVELRVAQADGDPRQFRRPSLTGVEPIPLRWLDGNTPMPLHDSKPLAIDLNASRGVPYFSFSFAAIADSRTSLSLNPTS